MRVLRCFFVIGLACVLLVLGWLSVMASQANIGRLSVSVRPRYTDGVQGTACGLDQYVGSSEIAYIYNSAGELISANQTVNGQYSSTLVAGVYTVYLKSTLPGFTLSGTYLNSLYPDDTWSFQDYWKLGLYANNTAYMNPVFRMNNSYPPDADWKVAEAIAYLYKINDKTEPTTRVRPILHVWSTANATWNRSNQSPWYYWQTPGARGIGYDIPSTYTQFKIGRAHV